MERLHDAAMGDDRRIPWLILAAAPSVGPRTVARLTAKFGTPAGIIAAGPDALAQAGLDAGACTAIAKPDRALLEGALAWAERERAHLLTPDDPRYPSRLAEIPDAPLVLYVLGDVSVLGDPQLAIVGSRTPTPQGLATSRELAHSLAAAGLVVTSGLALGIDGAAHTGALRSGRTIAVLGTGPDRVYPATHQELAHQIAAAGALVTEYPPGTPPRAGHFPRRNRVISGLSLGVLVVEAAERSGSLITARLAAEQGREVFAVPGSIRNPRARGCHTLIRQGAKLVESADDILVELAPQLKGLLDATTCPSDSPPQTAAPDALDALDALDGDYRRLLDCMGYDPVALDELIAQSGLPAASVSSMLLLLELQGYVSSYPGGRYCRETEAR